MAARNGLGGLGNNGDGHVIANVTVEISAVAIETACSIGGSNCFRQRQCSSGGLDGSRGGVDSTLIALETVVAVTIVAIILRIP